MKLLLLLCLFFLPGHDILTLKFLFKIEVKADTILADPLGNLFTISGKTITRYNEKGLKEKNYSSNILGTISYADVSDPFRILLFYKDFNQIVFLDNTLTEISSPIQLDDLSIDQAEIACSSANGGFWVYNTISKQLVYFDRQLKKNHESVYLNSIMNTEQKPIFLIEKSDYIFMYVPETGILVFDKYGTYFKTLNLGKTEQFQVSDDKIIYLQDHTIFKYDMKFLQTSSAQIPDSIRGVKSITLFQDKIFMQIEESINLYKIIE